MWVRRVLAHAGAAEEPAAGPAAGGRGGTASASTSPQRSACPVVLALGLPPVLPIGSMGPRQTSEKGSAVGRESPSRASRPRWLDGPPLFVAAVAKASQLFTIGGGGAMLNVLASLGGLLPDDGERLYDVAWDARPRQMVVARSMPETAAQGKVPSWDVIRSKDMVPTALHLMQQSIATNADAVHNLDSLPEQKPAGEVPCDIGCPNDSVRMIERRGPHAPHRPEDMNHERGGPRALRRPVAMVATAGQAMPEHQSEEQPTERPRLAMPEAVAGDADDPDDADDSVGRPRHAMLRRLASRLEEEAAQEGTRRTPEMQAVVRAAVANAAASKDGKPLLAEARRIAQPQLRRIRRAPDEIDGAPSS